MHDAHVRSDTSTNIDVTETEVTLLNDFVPSHNKKKGFYTKMNGREKNNKMEKKKLLTI